MKTLGNIKNMTHDNRQSESGNVLFLILIAVALFAALSYAVTSSSRSGGGDANSETNLISSATITQYPAAVRTAIIRMVISDNIAVEDLNFDPPADFATTCNATPDNCVFHPSGGGATYVTASDDIMDVAGTGTWRFSGNYEITNIGLSVATDSDGNDIIAFLPDIKESICEKLNEELGIAGDNIHSADLDPTLAAQQMITGYSIPATEINIGTVGGAAALDGQAFGCVEDSAGDYHYYHVLVER